MGSAQNAMRNLIFSSSTFVHAMRDRSGPFLPFNFFANNAGRFLVSPLIPNGTRKSLLGNYGLSEIVSELTTDDNWSTRLGECTYLRCAR